MAPRKSSLADCGPLALALATIREDSSVNTARAPPPFCLFSSFPFWLFVPAGVLFNSLFEHILPNTHNLPDSYQSNFIHLLSTIIILSATVYASLPPSVTLRASARLLCFAYVDLWAYAPIGYTPRSETPMVMQQVDHMINAYVCVLGREI